MPVASWISFIGMHVFSVLDGESMFILHAHLCQDTSEGDSQLNSIPKRQMEVHWGAYSHATFCVTFQLV